MKLHLCILFFAALCVALFSSAADARANAININFAGTAGDATQPSGQDIDPSTTPSSLITSGRAGVDTSNNAFVWNNLTGASGTGVTGINESVNGVSTPVGTTVTYS